MSEIITAHAMLEMATRRKNANDLGLNIVTSSIDLAIDKTIAGKQ